MFQRPQRLLTFNEKGKEYNAERKKSKCQSIKTQITKLINKIESYSLFFDNVHQVQNGLQDLEQLKKEFETAYEAWVSLLNKESEVREAHRWYEQQNSGIQNFISGMKDWVVIAKDKIEQQLKPPSEQATSNTSKMSSASPRIIEKANLAELMAKSSMLERKQSLRNEVERLEIEEKIAIAKAREQALIEAEREHRRTKPDSIKDETSKSLPIYLTPRKEKEKYGKLSFNSAPGYLSSPQFDEHQIKTEIPATFREDRKEDEPMIPRSPFRYKYTPPAIKVSPIPSSVASKVRTKCRFTTDMYGYVPEKYDKVPSPQHRGFQLPPDDKVRTEECLLTNEETIMQFLDRQNELTEILTKQHQRRLLPPLSLSKFTNDPVDFITFMSNFESQIESKVQSDGVRLRYLEQYLDGEAKELIKGCQHKSPVVGYPEAKRLLKERYGDPYKISNAYIKRAAEWPMINSGDTAALDRLSTFLIQCVSAMESMSYLMILDHPQNLQNLVRKLPFYLQDRWRRHVVNSRESQCQIPGFKSFADFIRLEAKIATDPIFSKEALDKTRPKEKLKPGKSVTQRITSHVASTTLPSVIHPPNPGVLRCILCNETHDLDNCKQYMSKSLTERKKFLAEKQVCYACYNPGHRSRGCLQKRRCSVCEGRHPTGLHDFNFRKSEPNSFTSENVDKTDNANSRLLSSRTVTIETGNTNTVQQDAQSVPIVPVKLQWMNKQIFTYAMLDSCSTGTFITEEVRQELKAEGTDTKVLIRTINGQVLHDAKVVTGLLISDLAGNNAIKLPRSFTREEIPAPEKDIPQREIANKWYHLRRIADRIPDRLQNSKIGVLIGTNCPNAIQPRDFIASQDNGPFAFLTFAGWTLVGPVLNNSSNEGNMINCNRICAEELCLSKPSMCHLVPVNNIKEIITPKTLNNMLELEFNERSDADKLAYSQEDKLFLEIIEKGIKYQDGHYKMPLPFRDNNVFMPSNREQVLSRATLLKNRLLKNQKMREDYVKFMKDIFDKGYARRIPPSEVSPKVGKVWYLPHHGVYNPNKPDKIRVVFDCSASFNGISLNNKLLQGPDLTSSLVGVLTRFRKEPVAFQADIEAMFHQVQVTDEHRDFLRFLWWPNGDLSQGLQEHQMNVHIFGAVSSPSCANYAVRKTADDVQGQVGKETADVLRKNFYVDDCLRSEKTDEKAIERVHSLILACKKGGFHLTKITSNSKRVLETIPADERSKEVRGIDLSYDELPIERALGVQWHVGSDTFGFRIALEDKPLTRRGILSTISSVYDPLGFAAPVLLPGKRILQELCKSNIEWDELIPEEYKQQWEKWRDELPALQRFNVARCLKPDNFGNVVDKQIHSFSDASTTGYGQVSYLRLVNAEGNIHCSFLMGKARVTPVKPVTIPRLELTAAVVSSKIGNKLVEELDYDAVKTVYWTDSTTVLRYINNEQNRYHVYVANRVQTIRDNTDPEQWRYVHGIDNPADDASRGLQISHLSEQHRWINGPNFLWKPENEWPEYPFDVGDNSHNDPEIKEILVSSINVELKSNILERFNYFSSWQRLKRVVALIFRLVPFYKQNNDAKDQGNRIRGRDSKPVLRPITVAEMEKAESVILKILQSTSFPEEIATLKSIKEQLSGDDRCAAKKRKYELKRKSSLYRLDPIIDQNDLIRVGGRLSSSVEFSEDFKHPIILPKRSHITTLIIRDAHERTAHSGRGLTLNELRTKYWIINANSTVRHYITKCVKCRKNRAAVGQQKMADLPESRISSEAPFTYCAVDYFGPFLIKEKRKEIKRYGVIFTCLSSRAIHIETANSLETDTFLNALRRFIARRGPVREIYSDQGTNLMGAEKELKLALQEMDTTKLQEHLPTKFNADWIITWKRNPPSASHMGGAWERQIRTIRTILNVLIQEFSHALDDESFRTLMTEVEGIVNCRPLTFPSSDPQDLDPLTPNHILTMKSKVVMPPAGVFQKEDVYLRKRWKRVQYLANLFWTRWKKEYIQNLQPRVKWNRARRNFSTGDIVLIAQEPSPRNSWPIGRIVNVKTDSKGFVRSATVKTSKSFLDRPVTKLILLLEA